MATEVVAITPKHRMSSGHIFSHAPSGQYPRFQQPNPHTYLLPLGENAGSAAASYIMMHSCQCADLERPVFFSAATMLPSPLPHLEIDASHSQQLGHSGQSCARTGGPYPGPPRKLIFNWILGLLLTCFNHINPCKFLSSSWDQKLRYFNRGFGEIIKLSTYSKIGALNLKTGQCRKTFFC